MPAADRVSSDPTDTARSQAIPVTSPNGTLNDAEQPAVAAPAVPGHFEVRTSSSQVTRMHFFPQKKFTTVFNRRPQNTKAANAAEIVSLSK